MNKFPYEFYLSNEPNPQGLTFDQILNKDDKWLEENHNWVQWIFPTDQPSKFNPEAPIISVNDPQIKSFSKIKLDAALDRIFLFYQLYKNDDSQLWWLTKDNHNYLRLSRILRHTGVIMKQHYDALELLSILIGFYTTHSDVISLQTLRYWARLGE